MNAVFITVLFASLYGSIVGCILLAVTRILDGRVSPTWQLAFWALLVIKLIVPFGPQSNLSLFNTVKPVYSDVAAKIPGDFFADSGSDDNYTYSETFEIAADVSLNNAVTDASYIAQRPAQEDTAAAVEVGGKPRMEIYSLLGYVWAIGSVATFTWFVAVNIRLSRELKKKNGYVPKRVSAMVKRCADAMDIKRVPAIARKEDLASPALFGLIRPKILVNAQLLSLGADQMRYVIVHELSHYKRKDVLIGYLLVLFQAVHWFNPVIWLCFAKIRQYVEQACDQSAIHYLNPNEDISYAKALLEVAGRIPYARLGTQLLAASGNKRNIAKRIKMIKRSPVIRRHRIVAFVVCLLIITTMCAGLLTSATFAKGPDNSSQSELYIKLDEFFAGDRSFSGSVVISQGRDVVFSNSYGMADDANNTAMTMDTRIPIGLITSQFTLAGIMQLYEKGVLDLDDRLSKYIPDFPRGDEIKIKNLLTHSSGIEDYDSVKKLQLLNEVTEKNLIQLIGNSDLHFEPGTTDEYSGANYVILGYILEQASGMAYEEYMRENIFSPLGMKNTGMSYSGGENHVSAIAYASTLDYSIYSENRKNTLMQGYSDILARCAFGSHGMYSTANDLSLWTQAVLSGDFLSKETTVMMLTPSVTPPASYYKYGWIISEMQECGTKFWTMGRESGYFAYSLAYPDRDVFVSIVSNVECGGHAEWYGSDILKILTEKI